MLIFRGRVNEKRMDAAFRGRQTVARADTRISFLIESARRRTRNKGEWRNGIRVGLKNPWEQSLVGSNPTSPTRIELKGFSETELWAAGARFSLAGKKWRDSKGGNFLPARFLACGKKLFAERKSLRPGLIVNQNLFECRITIVVNCNTSGGFFVPKTKVLSFAFGNEVLLNAINYVQARTAEALI